MRIFPLPALSALALLAACGGPADDTSAITAKALKEAAARPTKGFDWDKWAGVVNALPCNWLKSTELAEDGVTGPAEPFRTGMDAGCKWQAEDGTPVLTLTTKIWPGGAENLNGERKAQIREVQKGGIFRQIGTGEGTVTAILRKDRATVSMFANSDEESALVFIDAHAGSGDTPEMRERKSAIATAVAETLIERYGL